MIFTDLSNPVVDDKLPAGLRKELNKLSSHPVLQVPMRTKGITAGKMGCCYWNANVISQSFGGRTVYGFLISKGSDEVGGFYKILGHAVWMAPEGKLVDVTNTSSIRDISSVIGFLPLPDVKLKLVGKVTEQIKTFYYGETKKQVQSLLGVGIIASRCFPEEEYRQYDNSFYYRPGKDLSCFIGKLVSVDGAKSSWLMRTVELCESNGMSKKDAWNKIFHSFGPYISPVTYSTSPIEIADETLTFRKILSACLKTGKSAYELFPNTSIFEFAYDSDLLTDGYGLGDNFVNPSLRGVSKGKCIQDIPPSRDVLEKIVLPKSKRHLNKLVCKADEYGLTPQEYLLMSFPAFSLHPHLVNRVMKSGREFQLWKDTKVKMVAYS